MTMLGIAFLSLVALAVGIPAWLLLDSVWYGCAAGSFSFMIAGLLGAHLKWRLTLKYPLHFYVLAAISCASLVFALVCFVGFVVYLFDGEFTWPLLFVIALLGMVVRQCVRFMGLAVMIVNDRNGLPPSS